MKPLDHIETAARDPRRAAEELLAVWRERPAAALAEAIARCAPEADDAADLGKVKLAGATERLAGWKQRPRDPRLVDRALRILAELPFTSSSSRPFYRELFAWLVELEDPRVIAAAETLPARWHIREAMSTWLTAELQKTADVLKKRFPDGAPSLLADEAAALEKLAGAAPKVSAAKTSSARLEGDLLAAVWAAPDDDAPRQVYADFLQEKGDPRGELIALQLSGKNDKDTTSRCKKLLAEHGRAWLGRIEPAILADFDFERGFLAKAAVRFKQPSFVDQYGELPEWSTVRELLFPQGIVPMAVEQLRALQHPIRAARSLRAMLGVNTHGVDQLCEAQEPWPIEILGVGSKVQSGSIERLTTCTTLPRLVELRHDAWNGKETTLDSVAWMWRAPFGATLRRIDAPTGLASLPAWITEMRRRPVLERVRLANLALWSKDELYSWILTLERAGDRFALTVAATQRQNRAAELADLIAALPADTLARLTVEKSRALKLTDDERATLEEAAKRQTHLESLAIP